MNKNKIIMAAIGGVALLAVLVFGYLAFSAWSEKGETLERVESERSNANRILSSAVPPTQASLDRINANTKLITGWRDDTRELLAAGDVVIDRNASATSFKATMGEDARALAKLPGGVDGKIVRDGFDFGFKSYIIDGNIPPEATLPELKRQWAEVKMIVELLSASGAVEVQGIEVAAAEKKVEQPAEPVKRGFGSRRAKKPAEPAKPAFEKMNYNVKFTARPLAVVKALNAFAASEHLMYVEGLTLNREKDMLGDMLGAGKKEQETGKSSRRRRGRKTEEQAAEEEGEEVSRKGLVTDPVIESPFIVTLKVQTIDFGTNGTTAEEKPAEAKADEKEDEE